MTGWFYQRDDEAVGPVSRIELRDLLVDGELDASTPIRSPGSESWHPAYETGLVGTSRKPMPFQLAMASWVCPLIAIGVNVFLRNDSLRHETAAAADAAVQVKGIALLVLFLAGFVTGVAALFGIPRYGWRRILIPAAIGILLNGAWLSVVAYFLLRALPQLQ